MTFVEQNVFAEYKTYIANKKSLPKDFKYAFVDDARVFEFISNLEQSAIKVFGKVDDIEHYFSHQISGMLLTYLKMLQEKKSNIEVKNAVDEIMIVSQSMQKMVNTIAEKVLVNEQGKYEELLLQQNYALIDFFIEMIDQNIAIKHDSLILEENIHKKIVKLICDEMNKSIFNKAQIKNIEQKIGVNQYNAFRDLEQKCIKSIQNSCNYLKIEINITRLKNKLIKIIYLINSDNELNKYFQDKLCKIISDQLDFPF